MTVDSMSLIPMERYYLATLDAPVNSVFDQNC